MDLNIPAPRNKRVVIVGGGFGGIAAGRVLTRHGEFQTVLVDRNNYHQFQPLLYQVATSGMEPTAISFPLRKVFRKGKDFHFRMAGVEAVDAARNILHTTAGDLHYDYLVLAAGTDTNYFGMESVARHALPLKSVGEALALRNRVLATMELAVRTADAAERAELLNFVVVGGGPTGVELAGALAELQRRIFPKDYPELDISAMKIYLLNAAPRLLEGFSEESSARALKDLERAGVRVVLGATVKDFDGHAVTYNDGESIPARTVIWASGVIANALDGISTEQLGRGRRVKVDEYNRMEGAENIFVIGDQCLLTSDPRYPNGHPQVAQVAIQQGKQVARNLLSSVAGKAPEPFRYKDKGSMATIGRNRAVAEIWGRHFGGFFAWALWLFVHLLFIIGVRNRLTVLFDWSWSYLTYDRPLRTIIRPAKK
ncbi:MAG: NAD(P)/FAD-dependent oxidoreductase [Rikenellaceae bacterium]|nr:NAD(P)/FAD-dependent oxidoreductase [Rikenellaceae bacterium]